MVASSVTVAVQALLDSIAADPDMAVDRLPIMGPEEHSRLLVDFNNHVLAPSEPCHAGQTIHGLLEHWAAATPDAPAVMFEVTHVHGSLRMLQSALISSAVAQTHTDLGASTRRARC